MHEFELMLVVRPDLTEQGVKQVIEKAEEYICRVGGKASKSENWGLKRIAYEIEGFDKAYYLLIMYSAPYISSKSLQEIVTEDKDILRHMIIHKQQEEED